MGVRNHSGVRREVRDGRTVWVLDFRFVGKDGRRQRYRRDAEIQSSAGAHAEAQRRMRLAVETGSPYEKPDAMTFREFVEGDFETLYVPKYRPTTARRYRALFRQGMLDALGSKPLDAIGFASVQAFVAPLAARGLKIRHHLNLVRTVLRAAVELRRIEKMPELPKAPKQGMKVPIAPTDEEVAALVANASGWLRAAIGLGAYAGLRSGEVRALEVRDVDLDGDRLLVRRAFSEKVVMEPKSSHERVVPLAPDLRGLLGDALRSKLPAACVVTCAHGGTPSPQTLRSELNALQDRLGLPRRSFHSLRHYFCGSLLRHGANVEAVRRMAGHSSLRVTQRYVASAGVDLASEMAKRSGK